MTNLSQKSGETQDLNGLDSEAVRVIAALSGTVTNCSDGEVAATAFSPLYWEAFGGIRGVAGANQTTQVTAVSCMTIAQVRKVLTETRATTDVGKNGGQAHTTVLLSKDITYQMLLIQTIRSRGVFRS